MHAEMEALRNEVQGIESIAGSVVAFIKGFVTRQNAAFDAGDLDAARAMTKQLHDAAETMAAAIAANTPAAGIAEPMGNANPSPGTAGPSVDQPPDTANPLSPDAVPQPAGINATPAASQVAAESGDLPEGTQPGTPATL